MQKSRRAWVIDFFGLGAEQARLSAPEAFQQVADRVKPARDVNRRASYRDRWWIFSEPRPQARRLLHGLSWYIGTAETSKHRVFVQIEATTIPEHPLIAIGVEDSVALGVLSSRIHVPLGTSSRRTARCWQRSSLQQDPLL